MRLKAALLITCVAACTLVASASRSKPVSVEEFVTSHKVPESVARPLEDADDEATWNDGKHAKKVIPKFEYVDKKSSHLDPVRRFDFIDQDKPAAVGNAAKRQVRVQLENFSDTGVLVEDGLRRADTHRSRIETRKDSLISGVRVSEEYPTTMMPVLTTTREARGFDFVPVNIIRDDGKETSFHERNFGDFSDVSLVPAGTNSRIQVKKGPNGKDYEYEYVYYYYDEEDETKAGTADSAVTNSYDVTSRTTSAPRRGGSSSNRNKYGSGERASTVEPASNEVIPNRNGSNRGRQLIEAEDVSEERLPTNTRFPPRSRSNHNTGTTEPTRTRGNRPRPGLDLVDSSSFRTHQEGPEFPQVLPKGPVRFLGVTPNEENGEEKATTRGRGGRPQRIQEPAPVEEQVVDDLPAPATRRRPVGATSAEIEIEPGKGESSLDDEEKDEGNMERTPAVEQSKDRETQSERKQELDEANTASTTTDNPTTEYPSPMDKVALDLYAFVQQGQNNLVDASSGDAADSSTETTTLTDDASTDFAATTDLSATAITTEPTATSTTSTTEAQTTVTVATTSTTTSTTTASTTTVATTTTTEPSTTAAQPPAGRGKFRRPGIGGIGGSAVSRNRFKSNGSGSTTTTEATVESTQRTRGRFGANGSNGGGFKRPRPGQKPNATVEEDAIQKESSSSVQAERPSSTRGRFRGNAGTGTRSVVATTPSTPNGSAGISRPTFNKLNINRRRGRPTTTAPNASEESQETPKESTQEAATTAPKTTVRSRLPTTGPRPVIKPGARLNLRPKPGQLTSTTTTPAPQLPHENQEESSSVDEPAGEGTEEETHEAPAETSPSPTRSTTANPLNKLRNRNRLQVQPKTTTRSPVSLPPRRSPLLPRRKVTEPPAPLAQTSQEESSEEPETSSETESAEAPSAETSTAASTKHEETRGLGGLLAPKRRITPRRPGQIVPRE